MLRILGSFSAKLSSSRSTQWFRRLRTTPNVLHSLPFSCTSLASKNHLRLQVFGSNNDGLATFSVRWCSNHRETGIMDDTEPLAMELDGIESATGDLSEDFDALQPTMDDANAAVDVKIEKLFQCSSMDNVYQTLIILKCRVINALYFQLLEFIGQSVTEMDTQQVIKCILVLWEQYKKDKEERVPNSGLNPDLPSTKKLIQQITKKAPLMNPDELTTCLLYLSKLGLDMHVPVMCQIREICVDLLKDGWF